MIRTKQTILQSAGSAATVLCSTASADIFVKNDKDDGHLALALANSSASAVARVISCTFNVTASETLTAADLGIASTEVVDANGAVGDPATLTVDVDVL